MKRITHGLTKFYAPLAVTSLSCMFCQGKTKLIRNLITMIVALALSSVAFASIDSGISWLQSRQNATDGVHRGPDIANRVDTNQEALITLQRLSRTGNFAATVQRAVSDRNPNLYSLARLARLRVEQGQSAAEQLTELLAAQNADGGFPAVAGQQSEALTTAYVAFALARSGQITGTPLARAVGYLQTTQRPDGGWLSTFANLSSVYATSEVVMALQLIKAQIDVSTASGRAKTFLLSRRGADQSFGETFETALALDALLALATPRADLQTSLALLRTAQSSDGSFANDAYVTAVALRTLWQFDQPELPPSNSGLRARVLSAATELPIEGATLALTGAANTSLSSNNQGRIQSDNVAPGQYQARLSFAGMRELTFELTVQAGRILELGDLRLVQGNTPQDNLSVIRGSVRNTTGSPISGAEVRIAGGPVAVLSDAEGKYQILQVSPGQITVTATKTGFSSSQSQLTVAPRSLIDLTFELSEQPTPTVGATVRGTVTNATTNQAISNAQVSVVGGAPLVSAATAADGSYTLTTAIGTAVQLRAAAAGFDTVNVSVPLIANQVFVFSPQMYATGTTPVGSNSSSITGVVVNQANRQPLANALIVVNDPSGQRSVRSQSDGQFTIPGLSGPNTQLAFSIDAFEPTTLLVPLQPLQARDVGQVGLKPITSSFYLPDLRITDSTLASSNPDSFVLDSQFTVKVANAGTSAVVQDFSLIAFIDGNNNGVFDAASEPQVGRVRYDRDVLIGGSADIDIAVSAQLSFRDAPIAFWVDSDSEVIEDNNNNNTGSSVLGCQITPTFVGQNGVREKWRWGGLASNPNINSLMQVPSVTQLTDDNGDGQINEFDIPDLVFVAGLKGQLATSSSALVAVDGATGAEIWFKTNFQFSNFSSVATADIDNDGKTEIIVVGRYRQELYAFEHDGTLKWRVQTGAPSAPVPLTAPPIPLVWDSPVITNLDGDLEAEIILGKRVFRGLTGELLWTGEFDEGGSGGGKPANDLLRITWGVAPIAADVDLNGTLEVIAGRTLYDFEGRTLWHRADIKPETYYDRNNTPMASSGYTAVGNFDTDNFAEIVLAIDDELWLLEHTGETIWGPKFAPDNQDMGAPVIADVDQDGLPEILIASNQKASVFESDGTLKWTQDAVDTSGSTSLTVFDFQNDGNLEAIHSDEDALRIFDAKTGNQLYFTTNRSLTVFEYPIVADIDGDKEAEIIVTSFDNETGVQIPGVRVFEANGAWADAGSVWGSHAFHIDEVKENSTIPLLETPSWLTHNTYRVQRSPTPDPLGMPDFTVGNMRLIESGAGQAPRVTVRVGNAGGVDAHSPALLGLYRGDPAAGGTLLREMRLDLLRPKLFQEIDFGQIPLTGTGQLYAVVDQSNRARECREQNNQRVIPFSVSNGLGALQLATDKPSYRPGEAVNISATVNNQGAAPAAFSVNLLIRDAQNRVTANLPVENFATIAAAASRTQTQAWNSTGTLAGTYVVAAQLKNANGDVIANETVSFAITATSTGAVAGASIRSSKATYLTSEQAQLYFRAQNLSASDILRVPEATVTVTGPNGFNLERVLTFSDLFPAAVAQGDLVVPGPLANGSYNAVIQLRSRLAPTVVLATDTTTFNVATLATIGVSGAVSVAQNSLAVGQMQTCLFTIRNQGSAAANNLSLRRRVVEIDSGVERASTSFSVSLAPGGNTVLDQQYPTAGFNALDHACLLELNENGTWRVLDAKVFALTETTGAPGIVVSPTQGLVTSESGQSAIFTVRLSSVPAANVTIALTNPDTTEFLLSAQQLVFTPSNWADSRTITVTGVNDDLADGDQAAVIRVDPAVSTDPNYSNRDGDDVGVTNLDDEAISIRVSPVAIDVNESGTSATVNISANAEPTSAITIPVRSSDATEFSLNVNTITITPSNWQTPQALVVTGLDDTLLDGLQIGSILTDAAQSSDTRFNGVNPADVVARNADNELPGIIVEPVSITTSERGQAQSFVVRLNALPTSDVNIALGAVDASEWEVLDLQVVLNASNWQQGRTVTVTPVNDNDVDGDQTGVLVLQAATSTDLRFNGIDPSDVALTNLDDDGAQILVDPINGLVVNESGSTVTFNVRLTLAPTAAVTVALLSGDGTELSVAPAQLSFAAGSTAPQTVTVTGVDDTELDGNIVAQIITQAATSVDKRYNGINPANVIVTNLDNESAQVFVTPLGSVNTSEDATTANIGVRLSTAANAEVRIPVRNNDPSEWSLNRTELVFAAGSTAEQIVTVTGVNDFLIDGDILGVIELGALTTTDVRFNGINPPDVPAINRDNDAAPAFIISPNTRLTTTEAGGSAFFDVRLSTEPSASVSVPLSNPDSTEFLLDRKQISFDPTNWRNPQRVLVTGVDDTLLDADIEGMIGLLPAQSADTRYQGINPPDVPVININDDFTSPGVLRVNAIDLSTSESGETGRIEVVLNRAPVGSLPVLIGISSGNTNEIAVAPVQLSFAPGTTVLTQTVTLQGVDEFIDDGDQSAVITVRVLPGSDPDFLALPAQNVTAINVDNDTANVSFLLTGNSTITEGQSTSFSVVLASRPTAPVQLDLDALIRAPGVANTMIYNLSANSVSFTPDQWNQPRTITLSTRDNQRVDPDQTIDVRISRISSSDPLYPPIVVKPVAVRVRDVGVIIKAPLDRSIGILVLLLMIFGAIHISRVESRR
jgi:citrate lyase gamma subunit